MNKNSIYLKIHVRLGYTKKILVTISLSTLIILAPLNTSKATIFVNCRVSDSNDELVDHE